jgi:hypothetical protein
MSMFASNFGASPREDLARRVYEDLSNASAVLQMIGGPYILPIAKAQQRFADILIYAAGRIGLSALQLPSKIVKDRDVIEITLGSRAPLRACPSQKTIAAWLYDTETDHGIALAVRCHRALQALCDDINSQIPQYRTRTTTCTFEVRDERMATNLLAGMRVAAQLCNLECTQRSSEGRWVDFDFYYPAIVPYPLPNLPRVVPSARQLWHAFNDMSFTVGTPCNVDLEEEKGDGSSSSSSSSSSLVISLDEDPEDDDKDKDPVAEAFNNHPTRVLVGTEKLSMPFSRPHMLQNSAMWRKAVEGGDEPLHIMAEMRIAPNDSAFQCAWMRVNGITCHGSTAELAGPAAVYLDYLMFKAPGETDIQTEMRKAQHKLQATYRKREHVFSGESEALELVEKYNKLLADSKTATVTMTGVEINPAVRRVLEGMGFEVEFAGSYKCYKLTWQPPAAKKPLVGAKRTHASLSDPPHPLPAEVTKICRLCGRTTGFCRCD